jgi:16S rRNA (cytosine967-C5)-methyltransferase
MVFMQIPSAPLPDFSVAPPSTLSAVASKPFLRRAPPNAQALAKVGAVLSQALVAASWVTHHVAAGQSLPSVLRDLAPTLNNPSLRGACQDLAYQAQRQRGMADALIRGLTKKPFDTLDAGVLALLRTTLALICNPDEYNAYEAHTVVNQAVDALPAVLACGLGKTLPVFQLLAHNNHNTKIVAGFVNGVLRTYLREANERNQTALKYPEAHFNHPDWWINRLKQDYPTTWQSLLKQNNRPPAMALRANARIHTALEAQKYLLENGITSRTVEGLPNALVLDKPMPVEQIPGFSQGWFSVQDLAAQHCVELLDVHSGQRVLDACAAPGGKTAHVLERNNVTLTALDNDFVRLEKLRQTLQRLARTFVGETPYAPQPLIELQTANANQTHKWWDGQPFDRIVLDAPCSASGVVRRHPDSRWLRRANDITQLTVQQADLLRSLWPCLAVGGLMLYVTCSVFKAEGEGQIAQFLLKHADAQLLPSMGHCMPLIQDATTYMDVPNGSNTCTDTRAMSFPNTEHDGFFYALLRKVA